MSELKPYAHFDGSWLSLYLSDGLNPLAKASGEDARAMLEALRKTFGEPDTEGRLFIPLQLFPCVAAWFIAALGSRDPGALLKKALKYTPKVVADAVWELAYLSSLKNPKRRGKPMIDGALARRASKHMRGLLTLYHEVV
ncbi:hypothetical protein [Infirmifilum sp.]|uniref:hypothetical protein n=1 Tax=Infirmifilum sp. TaxID=2856575 RepID=UPI003D0F23A9